MGGPGGKAPRLAAKVAQAGLYMLLGHVQSFPMPSHALSSLQYHFQMTKKYKNHYFSKYLAWHGSQDLRNSFLALPDVEHAAKYHYKVIF